MDRLYDWLKKEAEGTEIALVIFGALVLIILYSNALWGIPHSPIERHGAWPVIIMLLIFSLAEEMIFRFLPLYLAIRFLKTPTKILIVATTSSLIFGVIHGGLYGVLDQGIGGMLICLVFLKCGGFQKRYWKAFATASTLHIAINLTFLGEAILFN